MTQKTYRKEKEGLFFIPSCLSSKNRLAKLVYNLNTPNNLCSSLC